MKKLASIFVSILLLFLLSYCTNTRPSTGTATGTSTLTITETLSLQLVTPIPPFTPEKTLSLKPTHTKTPVHTPTNQLPTLNAIQKDERFLAMLSGAEDCRWPCFGDMILGVTSWEESNRVFGHFVEWGNTTDINEKLIRTWGYKLSSSKTGYYSGWLLSDTKGKLSEISVGTSEYPNLLSVDKVLNQYGKPQAIYINAENYGIGGLGDLQILLVYPLQKAILWYEWGDKLVDEDTAISCDRSGRTELVLIGDDNFQWTRSDKIVEAAITYIDKTGYYPLEEITDMSIDQFTSAFRYPDSKQCITIRKLPE